MPKGKPTDPAVAQRVLAAYAAGDKIDVIVRTLGVGRETVRRIARRGELRRRPGRGAA